MPENRKNSIIELLRQGLEELNLNFSEKQLLQLEQYCLELTLWNSSMRLVGAAGEALIRSHVFDALAPLPELIRRIPIMTSRDFSCADFGSGNGLPGIPLAVMLPYCGMTLIERSGRRAGFLRNCIVMTDLSKRAVLLENDIRELQMSRTAKRQKVLEGSSETPGENSGRFDALVTRAVMSIADTYRLAAPLLGQGGVLIFYKGRTERTEEELVPFAESEAVLSGQVQYELFPVHNPMDPSRERTIAVIRKLFSAKQ